MATKMAEEILEKLAKWSKYTHIVYPHIMFVIFLLTWTIIRVSVTEMGDIFTAAFASTVAFVAFTTLPLALLHNVLQREIEYSHAMAEIVGKLSKCIKYTLVMSAIHGLGLLVIIVAPVGLLDVSYLRHIVYPYRLTHRPSHAVSGQCPCPEVVSCLIVSVSCN